LFIHILLYPIVFIVFVLEETLLENSHKYINDKNNVIMLKIINKDIQILKKSLPAGIWVKTFENRMVNNMLIIFFVLNNI